MERYRGRDLLIERDQAVPLAENENFIVDLIDLEVFDDTEKRLGVLTDVLQTGANDRLCGGDGRGERDPANTRSSAASWK